MRKRERAGAAPEATLRSRLQALCTPEEFQRLSQLIDERRKAEPESVRAFIVALVAQKEPSVLDEPLTRDSATGP